VPALDEQKNELSIGLVCLISSFVKRFILIKEFKWKSTFSISSFVKQPPGVAAIVVTFAPVEHTHKKAIDSAALNNQK